MDRIASQRAQASAELIAVVPLLLAVALAIGQLAVYGWALLSAGEAARAGARAAHTGSPPALAARRAVPGALGPAKVRTDGAEVSVSLYAPALLPGLPGVPVSAASALDPTAGR